MGKRPAARQGSPLWVTTADLPTNAGASILRASQPGPWRMRVSTRSRRVCARCSTRRGWGRPSLRPGRYLRMLLIGYFEGLSSERGIAWRVADSLSLRSFLDLDVTEDLLQITRRCRGRVGWVDVETHEAVFTWVLERLAEAGLVAGKTVGIDTYGEGEGGSVGSARGSTGSKRPGEMKHVTPNRHSRRRRDPATCGRERPGADHVQRSAAIGPRSRSGRCRSQRHQHRTNRNPHGAGRRAYTHWRGRGGIRRLHSRHCRRGG